MEEPIRVTKKIQVPTINEIRNRRPTNAGTPLLCIQNSGGAQIMARKMARRKGTTRGEAAFIPATTITKAAALIRGLFRTESVVMDKKYG